MVTIAKMITNILTVVLVFPFVCSFSFGSSPSELSNSIPAFLAVI